MDAVATSTKAAPTLPPECIEMILQYLWDDPSTLHQLSLCSRTLFNLIIPILYKSPFRLIADHRTWSDDSKSQRTARLIRLLYACSVTPSSSLEGDADPMSSSELSATPLTGDVLFKGPADWPELPSPLTTDYLFHYTHQGQIPKIFRALLVLTPSRIGHGSAPTHAIKTLTLALFGHSPGRIQTLSMTAHQLGCVLFDEPGQGISWKEGVGLGSLRMLRRLELDVTAIHTSTSWRNARGQSEWASNQNPTAEVDFPLIFIQEHQRLFRQSPVDHFGNPTTTIGSSNEPLPPPVLQELVIRGSHGEWTPAQLLSMIEPLEVVDLSAWNAGVPALDQIPQQRLKSFRTNIARRLESVQVPLEYLRRCSQLEEIWTSTQGANTFRWAIDLNRSIGDYVGEARLRRRRGQVTHSPTLAEVQGQGMVGHDVVNTTTTAATAAVVPLSSSAQSDDASLALLPVPPLTKIRLYGGPRDLIPSLEDALDAFRDNIEELSGFEDGYSRREEYPRMQITWSVPNLSYLDLQGRFVFFFDLRCLRHCPGLRTLKLHIESNIAAPYRRRGNVDVNDDKQDGQDVQDGEDPVWMTGRDYSVIAELSRLEELQLRGTSWNINNSTLQTLGGFSLTTADYDHPDLVINETEEDVANNRGPKVYRPTPLAGSLKYFGMTEAHLPSRAALVPFVTTMTKLKVISLGTTYSFAIGSLQEAAGPRLTVECTNSSVY
ncbi:hypothetical protein EC957_001412 [Mortierella hygrophila]|uniref:Uncharacterized protein n=1 Tax=Mortierella hygrophila TaxID=979708 RepID=A0A9P6F4U6_9FUNG|nr:hypothetical protein EC957_001412 [Mortierella hygrophila]